MSDIDQKTIPPLTFKEAAVFLVFIAGLVVSLYLVYSGMYNSQLQSLYKVSVEETQSSVSYALKENRYPSSVEISGEATGLVGEGKIDNNVEFNVVPVKFEGLGADRALQFSTIVEGTKNDYTIKIVKGLEAKVVADYPSKTGETTYE